MDASIEAYLEGPMGDSVQKRITPMNHEVTLVIPVINLLLKPPDPPRRDGKQLRSLEPCASSSSRSLGPSPVPFVKMPSGLIFWSPDWRTA